MDITPEEVFKIFAFVVIGFLTFLFLLAISFKLFMRRKKLRIMREYDLSEEEFERMLRDVSQAP